jgi:PhzF family phenazine biosynthesis protein
VSRDSNGIPIFHIDAFSDKAFAGNPAAVCLLDKERTAVWMQDVAAERWFTPTMEVDICGHATLASAHVLWHEALVKPGSPICFHTKSGALTCRQAGDVIELDFPAIPATETAISPRLVDFLRVHPTFFGSSKFLDLLIVDSEEVVRGLNPDFKMLQNIMGVRRLIVSSASSNPRFDFISRFFAPGVGINEDPVTGSAHCCLAPFWAERFGKSTMTGFQASRRGGIVNVRVVNDRVILGGKAVVVTRGQLFSV